jgi:hypothetical protein
MNAYGEKAVKRFLTCCSLPDLNLGVKGKHVLEWWNYHFIENRMRDFLFKYISNTLNTNARLANYAPRDANCTFCSMSGQFPVERETFAHLFYNCSTIKKLHDKAEEIFWPELNCVNENIKRVLWFCGIYDYEERNFNLFLQILVGTINYYIWECKIKKQGISWDGCKTFCFEKIGAMFNVSNKLRYNCESLNISFFRLWRHG